MLELACASVWLSSFLMNVIAVVDLHGRVLAFRRIGLNGDAERVLRDRIWRAGVHICGSVLVVTVVLTWPDVFLIGFTALGVLANFISIRDWWSTRRLAESARKRFRESE